MKKIVSFFATIALLSSCGSNNIIKSSDVNQSKIYRAYYSSFNNNNYESSYKAQYRVGGSTGTIVQLDAPSESRIELKYFDSIYPTSFVMDKETSVFDGLSYMYKETKPVKEHTYHWIRNDGKEIKDKGFEALPITISVNETPRTISKNSGFTVTLYGEPIQKADHVSVRIVSQTDAGYAGITKSVDNFKVKFSASELAHLDTGKVTITATRSIIKKIPATSEDLGGTMTAEYTSKGVEVELTN